jgi:(4-(4-[2-(gamma-L-glutamylamino)ethyl]phenoxymethyl)furan-2-yl)methanamine synthase
MARPTGVPLVLGLDVGGANLKAAHSGTGHARSVPYALWREPAGLADALRSMIRQMPAADTLAVTMTGELCDCFATKREGVAAILDAVNAAAGALPILVWQTDGRFVSPAEARAAPLRTAAANWLATATFAARHVSPRDPAMLCDIGSTTTDLVPLLDGKPVPRGRTDSERLAASELVYTGVRRTPVCALLGGGGAAEQFATTHDVALLLGDVSEDPTDCDTADGRPATRLAAHARLARMVCADTDTLSLDDTAALARTIREIQLTLLRRAWDRVTGGLSRAPRAVFLAGSGEFLGRQLLAALDDPPRILSMADQVGPARSGAAAALAVACLAADSLR